MIALRALSDEDVARVHAAALALLGAEGAAAEAAARSAPGRIVLGGRVRHHDVALGPTARWLATGGPAPRIRPFAGGEPRPATAADLSEACRLADALPEVGFVFGPPLRAVDRTALGDLYGCLAATTKHVQVTTLRTAAEAEAAVRMARALAGSTMDLRRHPPISLCVGDDGIEAARTFARAGLPVGHVVSPRGAAFGGAGLAAALVRNHAGVLAACAAIQRAAPGAPFFYVAHPARAGLPAAGPDAAMFVIASAQLAGRLGLPVSAGGMVTASHEPDWHACAQNALASLSATAAGADVILGAGMLGAGGAFSAQQLVMDSEIHSWNARIAAGILVDEETLALDVIKDVGAGGDFLRRPHTRRHARDVWRPRLFDRSTWDDWVASDRPAAYEKATTLAGTLLRDHEVAALEGETDDVLRRIVAESGL
jgi:trimethylamine---corrinoid protein Co-methyltransferase